MASGDGVGHSKFDERRWPAVVVTLPPVPFTPQAFDAHCQQISSYFEREQPFGLVIDATRATALSAEQRRVIAEISDALGTKYPKAKHVVAVVVTSAMHRGIVKTILWLARQPVPTAVFASVEEGLAWVSKVLATDAVSPLSQ